jgi:hypothetical protein
MDKQRQSAKFVTISVLFQRERKEPEWQPSLSIKIPRLFCVKQAGDLLI